MNKGLFLPLSERYRKPSGKEIFMSVDSLSAKRRSFCIGYVLLGSVEEAALRAGFPCETALNEGIKCLKTESCRRFINQLRSVLADSGDVLTGLKRLAFGSCKDAVYLVFADELPPKSVVERLDLFNVSEIKRVKGGGVEIKFFDRIKALEKLFEFSNTSSDRGNAADLIKALSAANEDDADD